MAKNTKTYTEEQIQEVLSKIPDLGISKAAKSVGIPWQTVRKWAKEAGLISDNTSGTNVETDVATKIEEVKKAAAEKVEEAKDKIDSAHEAAVPTEIEVKKAARKAGREVKKAAEKAVNTVKRTAKKAKIANLAIIIQSPLGGNITVEEIADKVPADADAVFVRVDQNKLWWTRGDEKGDVDIWEEGYGSEKHRSNERTGPVMGIFMCKTPSNSNNLQDKDLPPVMLITGKEWRPSEKQFLQWSTSYPDTDLQGELRRMEEWFQKHPDRRKTERGMHTFVKVWLDQKKRGGAVRKRSTNHGRYQNAFNDFSFRQEYDFEELEAELLSTSGWTDTI